MKKIFLLPLVLILQSCFLCPKCPPTVVCPKPPVPREMVRPHLNTPALKVGDPAATVIKVLEDDLGKCLRYADDLNEVLNGYR